jgi:hypothetical protein
MGETAAMVRLVDLVMYNGEPVAELRLRLLSPYVDEFVFVEAAYTHSGVKKLLYSDVHREKLLECAGATKLTVLVVDEFPSVVPQSWLDANADARYMIGGAASWFRENYQRDFAGAYVSALPRPYVAIVSDVDEIPSPAVVASLRAAHSKLGAITHLEMDFYMYNFSWCKSEAWTRAFVVNDEAFPSASCSRARTAAPARIIGGAGWHCSYFCTASELARKLASFAHQEFNSEEYTDLEHIRASIRNGGDVLMRGESFVRAAAPPLPAAIAFQETLTFAQRY